MQSREKTQMQRAVSAVRQHKMKIRVAAREFNAPLSTLSDHVHGRVGETRTGRTYPYKVSENGPSDEWFRKLFARHPELQERTSESLDPARSSMSREDVIYPFFDFLDKTLTQYGVKDKPSQTNSPALPCLKRIATDSFILLQLRYVFSCVSLILDEYPCPALLEITGTTICVAVKRTYDKHCSSSLHHNCKYNSHKKKMKRITHIEYIAASMKPILSTRAARMKPILSKRAARAYTGPIWAANMGPRWGMQPGSIWIPSGLPHIHTSHSPHGAHIGTDKGPI
ncbi:hypothetical protein DPMN_184669 [Dreissena polymorpha]|uniref:HTH psq-type domain-containing protein n=1 Tax=Dreissena polymorpha TaxID=45954 RepID=A0A9D4DK09_DREPO|nr:hypothetical protein DPMN_184669 [Dreissena polymorpha]